MKVLFCHPGAEMYGSDRMALETVKSLKARGIEVITILPEEGELSRKFALVDAEVRVMTIPVLRKEFLQPAKLVKMGWRSLVGLVQAHRLIRTLKVDVVIANTITQPVWIYAARLAGRPVFCHVREAEDSLNRAIRAVLVGPLSLTQLVVSNSKATERFVRGSSVLPLPETRVIYNAKDWSGYFRSVPEHTVGRVRMVLIGRISPRKGQDTAIEALRILRERGVDAELRIIGDIFTGYEWFQQDLLDLVTKYGLEDVCSLSGFVNDIAGELERCNVALVPSRLEPFGTVAAESMAAMRCTIVSQVQGLVEIVEDGVSGLCVDAEDATAWADAVQSIADDPDRALYLARTGKDHVLETFSLSRYSDEVFSAVTTIARRPR